LSPPNRGRYRGGVISTPPPTPSCQEGTKLYVEINHLALPAAGRPNRRRYRRGDIRALIIAKSGLFY